MKKPRALAAAAFFVMLAHRLTGLRIENGSPELAGYDSYYQLRAVRWGMEHWPRTLGHDPWTGFPEGSSAGQFGTLLDFVLSTAAIALESAVPLANYVLWMAGLGFVPAVDGALWAVALQPALLGALVAVPVYFMAARLEGPKAGLAAVVVLALVPGVFMQRTMAGFGDHHAAEALLQATTATLFMCSAVRRDYPVALLVLPGLAMMAYVATWPPAVYFAAVPAAFVAVAAVLESRSGEAPVGLGESLLWFAMPPAAFSLAASGGAMSVTSIGTLHVAAFGALWAMALVTALLASSRAGPVAFSVAYLAPSALAVSLPAMTGRGLGKMRRLLELVTPYDRSGSSMIAEAQAGTVSDVVSNSGLTAPIALAGAAWALLEEYDRGWLFVLVWAAFTVELAVAQGRFHYYAAAPLAVAGGAAAVRAARRTDLRRPALAAVVVLAAIGPGIGAAPADQYEAHEDWEPALQFLDSYAGDPGIEYTGGPWDASDRPEYAVLAWWDYGHWLLEDARVPVVANPMQQNSRVAANFLAAPNGSAAGSHIDDDVRYVVVDEATAHSKLPIIIEHSRYDTAANDTVARAMFEGRGVEGWSLLYSDCDVKIYQRAENATIGFSVPCSGGPPRA